MTKKEKPITTSWFRVMIFSFVFLCIFVTGMFFAISAINFDDNTNSVTEASANVLSDV